VSSKLRAAAKAAIRRAARKTGYEIVPFAAGSRLLEQRALQTIDLLVDVGANVGQYAERARSLGYTKDIVSFEPGSQAFEILAGRAQRDPNWTARNVALGAHRGTTELHVSANSVSSSVLQVGDRHLQAAPNSAVVATEQVALSTLSAELADHPSDCLYLKLDVQGYELPVLRGGIDILRRVQVVRCEVSFDALYEEQSSWLGICSFLDEHGSVVRYIEPGYEDRASGFMLQADLLATRDGLVP
jgi:FkbM family methyltransferase